MNFLRLTYSGTNSATLINMDDVRTMYAVTDPKGFYEPSTKVSFKDGSFINVREDVKTIQKLLIDVANGIHQDTEWEEEVATPKQRFENNYRKRLVFRDRNYNSADTFNENQY